MFLTRVCIAVIAVGAMISHPAQGQYYDDVYANDPYPPYPTYELPDRAAAWARAATRVDASRQLLDFARDRWVSTKRNVLRDWARSPEMRQAAQDVEQARARYANLRQQALAELRNVQPYQHARDRAEGLTQLIRQIRANGDPDQREIEELARQHLYWMEQAGRYETQVLNRPEIDAAYNDLLLAQQNLRDIQDRFLVEVEQAPEVIAARQEVADALYAYSDARQDLAASAASYQQSLQLAYPRDTGGGYSPFLAYPQLWPDYDRDNNTRRPFLPVPGQIPSFNTGAVGSVPGPNRGGQVRPGGSVQGAAFGDVPGPPVGGSGSPVGAPNTNPSR